MLKAIAACADAKAAEGLEQSQDRRSTVLCLPIYCPSVQNISGWTRDTGRSACQDGVLSVSHPPQP